MPLRTGHVPFDPPPPPPHGEADVAGPPAPHATRRRGFTLVELLVVIGIISVLISILLPALQKARDSAYTIKCAANLRSIGQGMAAYMAENNQYLPVAYNYRAGRVSEDGATQTPAAPTWGYVHWSSHLLGRTNPEAFQCPAMRNGGLPAADPPSAGDFEPNQVPEPANTGSPEDPDGRTQPVSAADGTGAVKTYFPDAQAPRMAYTLNEALCGRNKYVKGFAGSTRTYRNVRVGDVENAVGTILATEFIDEWGIVAGVYDGDPAGAPSKSHRPVQPFRAAGNGAGDTAGGSLADVSFVPEGTALRRTNATDFYRTSSGPPSFDPIADYKAGRYSASTRATRLDLVGRNHGRGEFYVDNKTNFLYLDGHVETKSILETVPKDANAVRPWEWGRLPYSVTPNTVESNSP